MSIIVMFDLDGDSAMNHPVTKYPLMMTCGQFVLRVSDYDKFVQHLYENDFDLETNVHETIIMGLEFIPDINEEFMNHDSGYYQNGNYTITIIDEDKINIV